MPIFNPSLAAKNTAKVLSISHSFDRGGGYICADRDSALWQRQDNW